MLNQDLSAESPHIYKDDVDELVGYLLTQIDASVVGENKEYLKSLIKQYCWDWFDFLVEYEKNQSK